MKNKKLGLLILSGISILFAIGARYLLENNEMTGSVIFWLFIIALAALIAVVATD